MNNKDYWEKRQSLNYMSGEKTASELEVTMRTVYHNALKDINKEIEAFYGRYAENNNLSLEEVNKRLDPKQLKSVKEELKKYYDMADPARIGKNMSSEYRQELRLQSAKSYMSRLEALKADLKNITVNLGAEENKAFYQTLEKIYGDTYKRTNFEIDKFRGYSTGFTELNYKKLNTAIHQKWLGMNFSDRIWQNKGKLLDSINTTFLQGIAQGKNPNKIAIEMNEKMKTGLYNCQRLARTESAHIINEATLQGYTDRGISKQYQFVATLDNRTSDICQELDGKVFDVKSAEVGVNYPPMHPNCRSTTIPYFETDEIDNMFEEAQRVARDENGELYYVPANMNYKQWQDIFVNKTEKPIEFSQEKHFDDYNKIKTYVLDDDGNPIEDYLLENKNSVNAYQNSLSTEDSKVTKRRNDLLKNLEVDFNKLNDKELINKIREMSELNTMTFKGYRQLTVDETDINSKIYSIKENLLKNLVDNYEKRNLKISSDKNRTVIYVNDDNIQLSFHHKFNSDYLSKLPNDTVWDGVVNAWGLDKSAYAKNKNVIVNKNKYDKLYESIDSKLHEFARKEIYIKIYDTYSKNVIDTMFKPTNMKKINEVLTSNNLPNVNKKELSQFVNEDIVKSVMFDKYQVSNKLRDVFSNGNYSDKVKSDIYSLDLGDFNKMKNKIFKDDKEIFNDLRNKSNYEYLDKFEIKDKFKNKLDDKELFIWEHKNK